MTSPFPGMDPFLEAADVFPSFHDAFITHLYEALNTELPDPYYALTSARIWVEWAGRPIGPDVRIHRKNGKRVRTNPTSNGGTATLTRAPSEAFVVTVPADEIREPFINLYAKEGKKHRLVTSIEILSPTNKSPGKTGYDLYRQKQNELLTTNANLVEIDLLRGGKHTTAVRRDDAVAETGGFDYHVCCHRFDRPQDYFVYPILLEDSLPAIAIPLLPGDQDIVTPLQPLFDRVYDASPYRRAVDYRGPVPEPPLGPAKAKWVKKRLAQAGLLKRK